MDGKPKNYHRSPATSLSRESDGNFLGAILAAGSAFWSSIERASYEHRISELSQEIMSQTTGGESYCYVKADPIDLDPQRFWVLSVWHVGKYPCFDVTIQIKDVGRCGRGI